MLQLKCLFCMGSWGLHTQKSMGEHSKKVWKWLVQMNEGGAPFNCNIGLYTKEEMERWPCKNRLFVYVYLFGYRWYTK